MEATEYIAVVLWKPEEEWLVVRVFSDSLGKKYSDVVSNGMTEKWANRIAKVLNREEENA